MSRAKIVIVVTHPIQHFCPMYAKLAASDWCDLHVIFAQSSGAAPYFDEKFKKTIRWSNLNLDKFSHEFLVNTPPISDTNLDLSAPDLENRLDIADPQVLIVYGYAHKFQRRAMRWAKANNRLLLMISDAELRSQRGLIKSLVKRIVVPRFLDRVDGFLTVGDSNEDYYAHYGASKSAFFRTPFPIDIDTYHEAWEQRSELRVLFRQKLGIESAGLLLSMVGKLHPGKQQEHLLEAFKHVGQTTGRITVCLIGSGDTEENLRKLAGRMGNQHVIFAGFVDPSELPGYYAATDIYVHTSRRDSHPLAVSEAIYMGCPLIANERIASISATDDIQVGRNALIYQNDAVNTLSDAITRLSENRWLREEFSINSHKIAIQQQERAQGLGLKYALVGLDIL